MRADVAGVDRHEMIWHERADVAGVRWQGQQDTTVQRRFDLGSREKRVVFGLGHIKRVDVR